VVLRLAVYLGVKRPDLAVLGIDGFGIGMAVTSKVTRR
jgi:hypothetical protein